MTHHSTVTLPGNPDMSHYILEADRYEGEPKIPSCFGIQEHSIVLSKSAVALGVGVAESV
jgi:hypothetical protein